jgi:phage tail sheath gpL-like
MGASLIAQPNTTFSLASADAPVENAAQKVLIVGQYSTAGAGVANQSWHKNIGSDGEEIALFGRSSQLAAMIRAFKKITDRVQLDVIALDGTGGTARIVSITASGTATAAGSFTLIAASELNHKFTHPVAVGDTSADIVAALKTLVNADLDCPFTANNASASVLTLTCDTTGPTAAGLPVEILGAATTIVMGDPVQATPGATEPSTTTMFTQVGNTRYQGIVWPLNDSAAVTAHLDPLFNANNKIQDGVAFLCRHDTLANHTGATYLTNAEMNSRSLVYLCDEETAVAGSGYLGAAIAEPSYVKSTMMAAIRSLRLTSDLAISQFVTSAASLDQFGGPALASLPYFNTPFPHLPVPGSGRGWTDAEIETLLAAGGGVLGQNPAGSAAIAGEIPTTYRTDPAGNDDITWQYLNYVDTASGAREYFHNNVRKRFAQSRLTQGAATAGRDVVNKVIIKAYLVQLYEVLSGSVYTLVQAGPDAVKFYKQNIVVTINMAIGKATITMKLPILTQLRTIQATVKIDFDITR